MGRKIIERRNTFISQLNEIIYGLHLKLTGGKEELQIVYEPDVLALDFEEKLQKCQERDIRLKQTSIGFRTAMISHLPLGQLIFGSLVRRTAADSSTFLKTGRD